MNLSSNTSTTFVFPPNPSLCHVDNSLIPPTTHTSPAFPQRIPPQPPPSLSAHQPSQLRLCNPAPFSSQPIMFNTDANLTSNSIAIRSTGGIRHPSTSLHLPLSRSTVYPPILPTTTFLGSARPNTFLSDLTSHVINPDVNRAVPKVIANRMKSNVAHPMRQLPSPIQTSVPPGPIHLSPYRPSMTVLHQHQHPITPHSTPQDATSPETPTSSGEQRNSVLWGSATRLSDGSLFFPGVGRQVFSGHAAVLEKIRSSVVSDDSCLLRLPADTINFSLSSNDQSNNWLLSTSTSCGSRQGFHVCFCCHQSFTSLSIYHSHMMRPVARLLYRCHLCYQSGSLRNTHERKSLSVSVYQFDQTVDNSATERSTIPNNESTSTKTSSSSPYYKLLPDGIVRASNRCAIYAHFADAHSSDADNWHLIPLLLSVSPLPDSAWESMADGSVRSELQTADIAETNRSKSTTAAGSSPVESEIDATNLARTNNRDASNVAVSSPTSTALPTPAATSNGTLSPDAQPRQMVPNTIDLEFLGIWSDLNRAITNAACHHVLNVLKPTAQPIDLGSSLNNQALGYSSQSFAFALQHSQYGSRASPLWRVHASQSADSSSVIPLLPEADSPLTNLTLYFACTDIWKSHILLNDWYQLEIDLSPTDQNAPIMIVDDDPEPVSLEDGQLTGKIPPAACSQDLEKVISWIRYHQPHRSLLAFDPKSIFQPNLSSPQVTSHHQTNSLDSAASHHSRTTDLLRCLLCTFRTDDSQKLTAHLSGEGGEMSSSIQFTKCALCSLAMCSRKPNLCSVKAHLLLHVGIYLMCPQCGFTPPPHLAPDMGELCLRIHLRFVCFHYNRLNVHMCTYCSGVGKPYRSWLQLCQHVTEKHSRRSVMCLWCDRQTTTTTNTPDTASSNLVDVEGRRGSGTPANNGDNMRTAFSNEQVTQRKPSVSIDKCFSSVPALLHHTRSLHQHVLSLPHQSDRIEARRAASVNSTSSSNSLHASTPTSVQSVTPPLSTPTTTRHLAVGELRDKSPDTCFALVSGVDYMTVYHCPVCNQYFEHKESLSSHYQYTHCPSPVGICCYCCFYPCNRLYTNLVEFRQHLSVCSHARALYHATFESSNISNSRLFSTDQSQPSIFPRSVTPDLNCAKSTLSENRLCFCLYCGLGRNRLGVYFRDAGNKVPAPTHLQSGQQNGDEVTSDDQPASTNTSKDILSNRAGGARYFHNLAALHTHEELSHFIANDRPTACPWCERRLSCQTMDDVKQVLRHVDSHFDKNRSVVWYKERRYLWNTEAKDLPHCACGLALLDSPLALLSHASVHLLSVQPPLCNALLGATASTHLSTEPPKSRETQMRMIPRWPTSRSTSAHVPCCPIIYRHLRFALCAELDHYLDYAMLVNQPFVCPLCSTGLPTRWALSEHAFVEHWGSLCYICCLVADVYESDSNGGNHLNSSSTSSSSDEATVIDRIPPVSGGRTKQSTSFIKGDLSTTSNMWDHIYQCMMNRRFSLLRRCDSRAADQIEKEALRSSDEHPTTTQENPSPQAATPKTELFVSTAASESNRPDPIVTPSNFPIIATSITTMATNPSIYEFNSSSSATELPHKRRRSNIFSSPSISHSSSMINETDDRSESDQTTENSSQSVKTCSSKSRVCVLCGEAQTDDSWEEHVLLHRNPHMPWNGVQLCEPKRIVLSRRQSRIYKCYVCDVRFATRFGCQRHLTNRHKIPKSKICWDKLVESHESFHAWWTARKTKQNDANDMESEAHATPKGRSVAKRPAVSSSTVPSYFTSSQHQIALDQSSDSHNDNPVRADGAGSLPNRQSAQTTPSLSSELFECALCRITFLSYHSLSIHRTAAHSS